MQFALNRFLTLIKVLGIVLLLYTICRLFFYLFNLNYFSEVAVGALLKLFLFGIRFDLSALVAVNALFILLFLLPIPLQSKSWYKRFLKYIFLLSNSVALFANCADLAYFRYTFKRSTFDVFTLIHGEKDIWQLLPSFLADFWYVFIIWISLCVILAFAYKKINQQNGQPLKFNTKQFLQGLLTLLLGAVASVVGFRGGVQLIPIYNVTAAEYASAHDIPLVLNTAFSIIKTADLPAVSEVNYFNEDELSKIYSPYKAKRNSTFKPQNVVILILESFSKEYLGYFNPGKGYTPFLDSLINQSLVFTNAYANGKRSAEGIPAVLAGIPTLMNEPYLTSIYGSNTINSIASLLKSEGYTTAFYHGGTDGTMGFKEFCSIAGFDKYYGRTEYNNEADYDGHWGIWDEPYLNYFAQQLGDTKQPFLAALFTLSSHHPYLLPEKYKSVFGEGKLPIHKCIRYTDFALKEFFDEVKKTDWYSNTLFVITADHTGVPGSNYYSNYKGMFSIPIIFFDPGKNLKGINSKLTQQIDIMPGVLDYLGYSKPYFSFGKSPFDSVHAGFNVNYVSNTYQLLSADYLLQFDGSKSIGLFNHKTDSLLLKNILSLKPAEAKALENQLKAYVQTYNSSLIHNKMKATN